MAGLGSFRMDASGALALVRTAQDELVEVRDAPDKGAGAVGCFARLPCVFRCCAQLVFLPSSNLVMYLALCCCCCCYCCCCCDVAPRGCRLPPRTFLGSYAGRLVDLRQKDRVERLR